MACFAALEDPVVGSSLAFAVAVHNIPRYLYRHSGILRHKRKSILACLFSALPADWRDYRLFDPRAIPKLVFGAVFGVIAGAMVFLSLDELLPSQALRQRA